MSPLARQAAGLAGFVGISFLAAYLGARATMDSVGSWYAQLARPPWSPPNWVFGPVWTVLYACMGVAAWLVWRREGWSGAILLFAVQLALNAAWSFAFFGWRSPLAGLVNIVLLWIAIGATLLRFWLFVPYIAWVTFAAALNFAIWRLNR
jgi:benzodiazapine receptor